ncbi:hypothetical protein WN71_010125 [Streptomyces mangrovisoli]|uniref:Putative amidase domain-containing protein n=1 Tax=Streptomyces mangrovisoli TaxID=1428628 RepID=A0A1J4P1R8_9ACTN|nr:hypothetical protein WN71_010125 [Streptomyces mangrovisoli]
MTAAAASVVAGAALLPNWSAGAASIADDPTVDAKTKATFQRLADAVFTDRTDALVDKKAGGKKSLSSRFGGDVQVSSTLSHNQNTTLSQLHSRKTLLASLGEKYSAGKTAVKLDATQVHGRNALVEVTETTTLTYEKVKGNQPKTTGFQAHHLLSFTADRNGNWQLTKIADVDDSVAVNQVATPQTGRTHGRPTPKATATAKASASPTVKASPTPSASASTKASSTPTASAKATTTPDDGNPPEATRSATTYPAAANPKNFTASGYDYNAMVAYAAKYWNNYNPDYPDYSGEANGGDCTDFVSQVLKAGGWKHVPGYTNDFHKWFGTADIQSDSFVGVNEFSWFALSSGRVTSLANVYQADVGDVIQIDFNKDGSKDHSMIVTSRSSSGVPYVTYHSTNTYNRSLASIIASYPNAAYYAYRT